MEHRHGVGGEELAVAADAVEAYADVFGRVVGDERVHVETAMDARVERAIAAQCEAVMELREADQDEGEERAAVPLVVQEDVEVVEGVLVQEVRFVELCGAPHNSTHGEHLVMWSAALESASPLGSAAA